MKNWIKEKKGNMVRLIVFILILLSYFNYGYFYKAGLKIIPALLLLIGTSVLISSFFLLFYNNDLYNYWKKYTIIYIVLPFFLITIVTTGKQDVFNGVIAIPGIFILFLYIVYTPFYLNHKSKQLNDVKK